MIAWDFALLREAEGTGRLHGEPSMWSEGVRESEAKGAVLQTLMRAATSRTVRPWATSVLHVPERIRSSPDWLPLGSDISPPPSPSALALPPFGLADFDLRVLRHELLGNERDSHAPSRIHAELPPEVFQRKL